MNLSDVLNAFPGPALIIAIIFAECSIKYKGSRRLKKNFCLFLIITFFLLLADIFFSIINTTWINIFTLNYITKLVWPFIAAVCLYIYLFLILKENKIDILTGLNNRYGFYEHTSELSHNNSKSFKIIILDIDNFKLINEVYGNHEGDNVLLCFSKIIKSCIKKHDFAVRYSGDDFILVTDCQTDIKLIISKIEEELEKYNEKSEKPYNLKISYSYGTYAADKSGKIDVFISHLYRLMRKYIEEKRRADDILMPEFNFGGEK